MTASFVVHTYNEADALERLILSSLSSAGWADEWVVLDHRSNDHTQAILDQLEPLLAAHGMTLTRLTETRDLSRTFTFAQLRTKTIKAARNPIVALMDADFVLGRIYPNVLGNALHAFHANPRLAAIRHRIPIIWDHVTTNEDGQVTDHGRLYLHGYSHRLLRRDAVTYRQTGNDGRWEQAHYPGMQRRDIDNDDGSILVSLNIKPHERLARRATMTEFMRATTKGQITGNWLDHAPQALPQQPDYVFSNARITPVLNLANLSVNS